MEDLKQIQEFFSKPLEEMMSLDDEAKAYYLAKVKAGEIDTLPEDPKAAFLAQMTKDQIAHDKETLRRERGLEEGTFDQGEIAIYIGHDDSGTTHIFKRGKGYYGYNDEFDFEAASKEELQQKLDKWGYELLAGSLEENKKLTYNDFVRMVRDDMMAGSAPDERPSEELVGKRAKAYYNEYLQGASLDDIFEAETNVSDDIPDIIAVDVPLFIRLLEFAREDAGDDMDLHEVAERAIEAVKARGVLSMDDYDVLVSPKEELDETLIVTKDKIDKLARQVAAQISKQKNTRDAQEFLRKAIEDAYAKVFDADEYEIKEEEGYSKFLEDDPEHPGGKTKGLTPDVMNKILMKIVQDVDEIKQLGEGVIEEDLCPKGKAYIKKRMAAGEKSSAYLSGRAVKVCKGQMKG